jgi:alpha-galactosidase
MSPNRTLEGRLQADPVKFPRGIKFLADYAHAKKLKFGIYECAGTMTCAKYPGSFDHWEIDAQTFADWGIDFIKLDFCYVPDPGAHQPWIPYGLMHEAINKTGRPMVFSLCNAGDHNPWIDWGPKIAHMWRTTYDIQIDWDLVLNNFDGTKYLSKYAAPGGWNDPDMIEVGVKFYYGKWYHLSQAQSRSHFSLWCMLAAPLILGLDTSSPVEQWVLDIIRNKEVIAIDQDAKSIAATELYHISIGLRGSYDRPICVIAHCKRLEVWSRPLQNDSYAVVFFNRASLNVDDPHFGPEQMTLYWEDLGLNPNTSMIVRDLWLHKDLGIFSYSFVSYAVSPHDVMHITLRPVK